jgi:hypothetical protein
MRLLAVTVVVLALSSVLQAEVWMTVYRCDETTPLAPADPNYPHVYADIMVGTKLVVVVSSDASLDFSGFLQFSDEGVMSLTGRGYSSKRRMYVDSSLPAAGEDADVRSRDNAGIRGFGFTTDSPSAGDWFIFDYCAERVGSCSLDLYNGENWSVPIDTLSFAHVLSCDFNGDNSIDFEDLALLASHNSPVPDSVSDDQAAFDLNSDRVIDFRDLAQFSEHWLERVACDDPAVAPNQAAGL